MNEAELLSYSATAEEYGVRVVTISDIVRCWNLTPKPMSNGKAKGLDQDDRKVIRKALNKTKSATARTTVGSTV